MSFLTIIPRFILLLGILVQPALSKNLPPPVHNVQFEEWAAGMARLINQQPLNEILTILEVDETEWNAVNAVFSKALTKRIYCTPALDRYRAVFDNPSVGRFQKQSNQLAEGATFKSYDEFVRFEAHLSAVSRSGGDIHALLADTDMTIYQLTQEQRKWHLARYAVIAGGRNAEISAMVQTEEKHRAYFEKKYNISGK
ncbi:hypothetical protein [Flexibacterium corallicola]|uniref:hypothetical protein n=1 Tax=Flexibacterium corallicola TaxID=3037259 RepID=UPI00286F72A7|nr:hypothetical protein [Pseudovibrio sp. M1P-2-3]